jgi:hypothetical protein
MERHMAIADAAAAFGCDVKFHQKISENPDVMGAVFTRNEGPMPAFEAAEPEGTA